MSPPTINYLRILHRKIQKETVYFINPYNVTLFSSPHVFSFKPGTLTNKQLYQQLATMFKWMIPQTKKSKREKKSSGGGEGEKEKVEEEFPFEIRLVSANGMSCSRSPWYQFSIGTEVSPKQTSNLHPAKHTRFFYYCFHSLLVYWNCLPFVPESRPKLIFKFWVFHLLEF